MTRTNAVTIVFFIFTILLFPNISNASYTDNGDGTITDTGTGLMWQKNTSNTTQNWQNSILYCASQNTGGFTNWHLPNKKELESIVDYTKNLPAINSIFNTNNAEYWTSSTYSGNQSTAWTISFGDGRSLHWNEYKTIGFYSRCVRTTPPPTGSLQINLLPQSAISAGAQWNIDNGSWQNSGTTLSNITTGTHTVYFKTTNGWTAPQNQSVTISSNQTTNATGTYIQQTYTGSLQVNIQPQGAINAGAQWNIDNGPWQNSGTTLSNITTGTHTVYFKTTNGWTAPQNQSVTISSNQTSTVNANYNSINSKNLSSVINLLLH